MKLFNSRSLSSFLTADRPSAGWVVLFLITYITVFSVSGTTLPTMNLDDSWQVVLEYAVVKNMQFGTDIVFTYGPLGYLGTSISKGLLGTQRIVSAFIGAGITAWAVVFLAMKMPKPSNYLFIGCFLFLSETGFMEHYAYLVMAACSLLLLGEWQKHKTVAAAFIIALVFVSLIKFTLFLAAVVTLLVCCSVQAGKRNYKTSLLIALFFSAVFVVLWLATGQDPAHIRPWIKGSMEISGGYTEAMSLVPKPGVLAASIAAYLLFLTALLFRAASEKRSPATIGFLLLAAMYVFLSWKHGFVRADDHVQSFYLFLPVAFGLLQVAPGNSPLSHKVRTTLYLLNIVTICLCLWAGSLQRADFKNKILTYPDTLQRHARLVFAAATGAIPHLNQKKSAGTLPGPQFDLPRIRALVGRDTVDVFSHAQLAALENNLNYRPRPVIQSYSAYTPYLQDLNRAFYRSDKRPVWLLFKLQSIDKRFTALDDAPVLPYILKNYEIVGAEGDFVLLKLRRTPPADVRLTRIHEQEIAFGETLDLSRWNSMPVLMQVEMKPTAVGKMIAFLYQAPPLAIHSVSGAQQMSHRFIPALAHHGFMVTPLLLNNEFLIDFYQGKSLATDAVGFTGDGSFPDRYAHKIKVTLFAIN
jgi:hypothetical protein